MRTIFFLPMILLGACAANLPRAANDPIAVHIDLGDLALDRAEGRAMLRERVTAAVRDYCRAHSDQVTPQLIRTEASYCLDTMRQSILAEMPRDVRRAYALAQNEAR
ncbi:MAG: UrcA family protein [Sphingomonadales bacterium]|nr:MAG: UrcA family protein [Sphingomonadales bacterium]